MPWLNKKRVTELAEAGLTSSEIAHKEEKSKRSVQRVLKKQGLARPRGRPPAALDEDFLNMYHKVNAVPRQITRVEAAQALGCSLRTLDRKFKEIRNARRVELETNRSAR